MPDSKLDQTSILGVVLRGLFVGSTMGFSIVVIGDGNALAYGNAFVAAMVGGMIGTILAVIRETLLLSKC